MTVRSLITRSMTEVSCDRWLAEHLAPFGKAAVGGEDHRAALVAGVDQLEEQISGAGAEAEIADLVDDQQLGAAEMADALAQPALAVGAGEIVDDVGERGEVDAAAGAHRLDPERHRQVAFAGAGLADQVHNLVAVDEVELGESQDAIAVERRLEGEVEARQRLDRAEAGHLQRRLDAAALADGELLGEQHLDRLDGADLAAFDLLDEIAE